MKHIHLWFKQQQSIVWWYLCLDSSIFLVLCFSVFGDEEKK